MLYMLNFVPHIEQCRSNSMHGNFFFLPIQDNSAMSTVAFLVLQLQKNVFGARCPTSLPSMTKSNISPSP